ncbi:helix-turn-helix transcriptional regulator [Stutzerimonas nosocomialis]|uniref:LuxR C-terminal-related transcriptional regulator n=1 Tax=Stutzerimonas nosocomialis TaxID=1056496 RepID=UPI001109A01E|nr:helix-turn-helix transcriptional regulator [Stutzerimonas nosocomialis]TLX53812.1 helix-turn-helix transcriptional regulator [Stutzerimonas nosocomialis]
MDTIQIAGWQGRLGKGLAPRQLEATLWAASDMTAKEIARRMGCAPATVAKQLDDARFKLGMQRTTRGLCLEAMKRGIIAPLMVLLCLATGFNSADRPAQRPMRAPKVATFVRIARHEVA